MRFQIWLSNYPLYVIVLTAVFINVDPLEFPVTRVVVFMLSSSTSSPIEPTLISLLIRSTLIIIFLTDLLKAVNAFFIVGLMVVCSASEVLQVLTSLNSRIAQRVVWSGRNLQEREVKLYRELLIWMGFTNQNFCRFAVPPLIFFGVSFLIFGIYGSIRMRDQMQVVIYLLVPIASFLAFLFVVLLIPEAAKVFERSNLYLVMTRRSLRRGTLEEKVFRSLRPMGIQVASFGLVKNDLMKIVIRVLTENTCNLLITF